MTSLQNSPENRTTTEQMFDVILDHQRLNTLAPVEQAVEALGLSLVRFRKLNGILNALTMQIEDGGDNPAVNAHLIAALRAAILHQVGQAAGRAALEALERFAQTEVQRLPAAPAPTIVPLAPSDVKNMVNKINQFIKNGYGRLKANNSLAACQTWLEAWELIKKLARPNTRSRVQFHRAYAAISPEFENWCYDLMLELHNAGLDDRRYQETRITYIHEFLNVFSAENDDDDIVLNFGRGEGEALWALGRIPESEAVFSALVEHLPDEGWAYIGWADQYWGMKDSPKDYTRGEAILQRALQRPHLKDRADALERLRDLYDRWDKTAEADAIDEKLTAYLAKPLRAPVLLTPKKSNQSHPRSKWKKK